MRAPSKVEGPVLIWTDHAAYRFIERGLQRDETLEALRVGLALGFFRGRACRFTLGRVKVVARLHGDRLVVLTVAREKPKRLSRRQRKKARRARRKRG